MTVTDYISSAKRRSALKMGRATRETIHSFAGTTNSGLFFLMRSGLGVVFFVAGAGLWLLPGMTEAPEVRVMQMGLTALFMMIGYALFQGNPPSQQPELHIDLTRRCIHLGVRNLAGSSVTIAKYHLDELSDLAVIGTTFVASDHDGVEVVNLDLRDKAVANSLREFLVSMPPLYRRPNNMFRNLSPVA